MTASEKSNGEIDLTTSRIKSYSAAIAKHMLPIPEKEVLIMLPFGATLLGAVLSSSIYLALVPFLVIVTSMVNSEPGETNLQWWTKFAILQVAYSGFALMAAMGVLLPVFGPRLTGYHALVLYIPLFNVAMHDRRYQYGFFGSLVIQIFLDAPLVLAAYVCREFFGVRLMAPFCNIFDETIVQGSMPFPSDIVTLAAEPYNVGLVVNMCREYKGATTELKKHRIVQCYLPHQDTTAVSYESLVKGCSHIREFKKKNPKKRVYVHCKGGNVRASTMSLAHYIVNESQDSEVAIRRMKSQRHVIYTGIKDLPAIRNLNEQRLSKQKQQATKPKNG